jgi:GT2 family glycosyltransferase
VRLKEYKPERLARANLLPNSALYLRNVWAAVGGYNPNMDLGYEDWDFWVGAAAAGFRARRVPEPLYLYRVRANSRSSSAEVHRSGLIAQIRANHPTFFALLLSDAEVLRLERWERADLDYATGRAALREGRRSDAKAFFRRALRRGSGEHRAKAFVRLGCAYLGFDLERIAGTRQWVRSRRGRH